LLVLNATQSIPIHLTSSSNVVRANHSHGSANERIALFTENTALQ